MISDIFIGSESTVMKEEQISHRRTELTNIIEQCHKLLRNIDQQLQQARQMKQNFNLIRSNMDEILGIFEIFDFFF